LRSGYVAAAIGFDESTVSKWVRGRQGPPLTQVRPIGEAFGVSESETLAAAPYFLTGEPVSSDQRRQWLVRRVDTAPDAALRRHFPSLRRLLEDG